MLGHLVRLFCESIGNADIGAVPLEVLLTEAARDVLLGDTLGEGHVTPKMGSSYQKDLGDLMMSGLSQGFWHFDMTTSPGESPSSCFRH